MAKIVNIVGSEILDSRGFPTVAAKIILDNGMESDAAVPAGTSIGRHEAIELRDGDPKRYLGMGVLKAVENIDTKIAKALSGMEIINQRKIDETMLALDGTNNKSYLGANSILAVSLAAARAASYVQKLHEFQYIAHLVGIKIIKSHQVIPLFNLINGGLHGSGKFEFQEFLIIPASNKSFNESLQIGVVIYQTLKKLLSQKRLITSVGFEGGFTPQLSSNLDVLKVLLEAIHKSSFQYKKDVFMGLDVASSTFFKDNMYYLSEFTHPLTSAEFINYFKKIKEQFSLFLLEDPLAQDDWLNWSILTRELGGTTHIVGDDLLVSDKTRLKKAITSNTCNSIIVKVNQIGTLSETLDVIKTAKEAGFKIIISHRSGETVDHFISDLAVGVNADFVKFGAPARGERVAKYNRLLEIYKEVGSQK